MRLFTRLTVCAAPAMVLSALMFHVADSWFGGDSSVVEVCRQIVLEAQRAESLRARAEMVARSRSAKYDTLEQILAGRLRLRQAIIQFHRANEMVQHVNLDRVPAYAKLTDPQEVGRHVLLWVRNRVVARPSDEAERLLADLEHEYQTLFGGAKPDQAARVQQR